MSDPKPGDYICPYCKCTFQYFDHLEKHMIKCKEKFVTLYNKVVELGKEIDRSKK